MQCRHKHRVRHEAHFLSKQHKIVGIPLKSAVMRTDSQEAKAHTQYISAVQYPKSLFAAESWSESGFYTMCTQVQCRKPSPKQVVQALVIKTITTQTQRHSNKCQYNEDCIPKRCDRCCWASCLRLISIFSWSSLPSFRSRVPNIDFHMHWWKGPLINRLKTQDIPMSFKRWCKNCRIHKNTIASPSIPSLRMPSKEAEAYASRAASYLRFIGVKTDFVSKKSEFVLIRMSMQTNAFTKQDSN